jgi:hypothetical protein
MYDRCPRWHDEEQETRKGGSSVIQQRREGGKPGIVYELPCSSCLLDSIYSRGGGAKVDKRRLANESCGWTKAPRESRVVALGLGRLEKLTTY